MEKRNFKVDKEISSMQSDSGEILIEDLSSFSDSNKINIENFNYYNSLNKENDVTKVNPLSVELKNSFKARYSLVAVGETEKEVEITSRVLRENDKLSEIYSRALNTVEKNVYLNIMYRGNSDVYTEIQPIGYNNIPTEIEVRPHNKMFAIYEVQQPPIVTDIFNPTKDAFTREQSAYQSINYGKSSSMVVGRSTDDIWRSFVQFDLSSINPSYVLKESYLRLYYKGSVPENVKLELLNANASWQEYSITNINKPSPINLISNEFTINKNLGYIEFNVLDIIKNWVALSEINNGFIIRLSNENNYNQATFHTRETALAPELVVKYYDSRIFSQGKSQLLTEIMVFNAKNSDIETEITVNSSYMFEILDTEIYVHRKDVPIPDDILTEITVSKPYVPVEIIATIHVDDDILTEIGARLPQDRQKNVEIAVSKPFVFVEIYVRHQSDVNTELISRAYKESTIETVIAVNRPHINVEITPVIYDTSEIETVLAVTKPSVETEITIPINGFNQIFTEIEAKDIWTSTILTEIFVDKRNIPTEIEVRVERVKDLYTTLIASKPQIHVEVEVKHRNDIWVEIEPNIKSDTPTEITATKPCVEVSIVVQGYGNSDKNTEIYVRYVNNVNTEIDIKLISQVETEINVKAVLQVPVEISVTRREILTDIVIPTWISHDILTELEPRILMVDNIFTVIQVGSAGGAYAFII